MRVVVEHAVGDAVGDQLHRAAVDLFQHLLIDRAAGCRVLTADPQARDWADNLRRVAAEIGEAYGHG